MNNNLPPSPFGAGTRYDGSGKHIITPYEAHEVSPTRPPRISRIIGERATEAAAYGEPRIWREASETPDRADNQLQVVPLSDLRSAAGPNSYAGPASRQVDLERAEAENIIRAAAEAGMTVDQWKASRRQR